MIPGISKLTIYPQSVQASVVVVVVLVVVVVVVVLGTIKNYIVRIQANPQEWGYTNPPGNLTPPPGPPEKGGRPNGAEESKMFQMHYLQ